MNRPEERFAPDERPDASDRVQRQYASLKSSSGWLLGLLERYVDTPPEASETMGGRLRHAARELCWTSSDHARLHAFADRFLALEFEVEAGGASDDLALRLEQAACEALALYVAMQSEAAAQDSALEASLPAEDDEEGRRKWLAEIGAKVRARLDADARVEKLPANGLELYRMRDFVDAGECEGIIAMIERDLYPSGILGTHPDPEFRTSKSCNLPPYDPLIDRIDRRIGTLLGIARRCGESPQGQRYEVGQQFKPHHDFFHKGESYYEQAHKQGGQRTWTAMLFLNTPEAGGTTNFPTAGAKAIPEAGTLLIWNNMRPDGTPNRNSLHQGSPVEAGLKYVITKWFRERPLV